MGFILRRFSFYLVAFLVAATINFLLPRAMPGDPVSVMFARAGAMMEPAALEALKATFGFVDGPITTQFLAYVKSVFTWDLGTSVRYYPQPVADVLGRAIGWTLFLVGTSTILSFSIGSIVGNIACSAWRTESGELWNTPSHVFSATRSWYVHASAVVSVRRSSNSSRIL